LEKVVQEISVGKITLSYYSQTELEQLYELLERLG